MAPVPVTVGTKSTEAGKPVGKLRSEWIRAGGASIHTRVSSEPTLPPEAPPVVLVHGVVISSLYMVPTAERLVPFYRVFAPDLPGFGKAASRGTSSQFSSLRTHYGRGWMLSGWSAPLSWVTRWDVKSWQTSPCATPSA